VQALKYGIERGGAVLKIDEQIKVCDRAICRHISQFDVSGRGAISQDILSNLRNFVEHIMLKIYADGKDVEDDWKTIQRAVHYVKSRGEWKALWQFHALLQISTSHYTPDECASERLMLKYYAYLLKIKDMLAAKFSFSVLANIDQFPLHIDQQLQEYYDKIAEQIDLCPQQDVGKSDRYYVQKIKPFFSGRRIFYEVTLTPAQDYESKFNRIIAFTALEMTDFYAVRIVFMNTSIHILEKTMPVMVITGWQVSIRACEFKNFTNIMRGRLLETGVAEQRELCRVLTAQRLNLLDLIAFSTDEFTKVRRTVTQRVKKPVFFDDLEKCRFIIRNKHPGSNLLRYLLFRMNNQVIKKQQAPQENSNLFNLYAKNKSIPFDRMPFYAALAEHNPKLSDLFFCIDFTEHRHELLARLVKTNTEIHGQLFTPHADVLDRFPDAEELVNTYNETLWHGHWERARLVIQNKHLFINGYVDDVHAILGKLETLAKDERQTYTDAVSTWLNDQALSIDCAEKKAMLLQMFVHTRVALIYGAAGTGKSTLIDYIARIFSDRSKLFLAQTNPAIDNLRRRISARNCTFSTITKFLKNSRAETDYDLLFIDECSTVSNRDMRAVLSKSTCDLLILVGDSYQIASIRFGNWFSMARAFLLEGSVFELQKPYRSSSAGLLTLWNQVRRMESTILEGLAHYGYSAALDETIFSPEENDEIILCLNYDGLYGINNINRFLQESNPMPAVRWKLQLYKVNDPILFNETRRFAPVIYNNMKGRIVHIEVLDVEELTEQIQFDIELEREIEEVKVDGLTFLGHSDCGNTMIRFCVMRGETDDDDSPPMAVVPFQVAYAISIHKAQGLEYDSVKIVISDEVDEQITHNVFYTAITRARKKLKIYWTPEVEKKVLERIRPQDITKDEALLRALGQD
jgi:helicase, putative